LSIHSRSSAFQSNKGLAIEAEMDDTFYPTGIKIPDEDMAKLEIIRDEFHGEWKYRLCPINN